MNLQKLFQYDTIRSMVSFAILLLFSFNLNAHEACQESRDMEVFHLCKTIVEVSGREKVALKYAKYISKYSRRYGINPAKYTAIIAQESMFKLDAVNQQSNDYGLAQINDFNIRAHGMDKERLLYDAEYSIEQGAKVLSYFERRFKSREKNWFCRYNVGTGLLKGKIRIRCNEYAEKVLRYYVAL